MVYRIMYYDKEGKETGSEPWADSIELAKRVAQAGLFSHKAASARIFDEDQKDRQVWPRA